MTQRGELLTPATSLALDAVRAIAALVVVVGHSQPIGLYQGPWPISPMMSHVAVIVFFVLSGLVIANASLGRETDLRAFAVARIARIVPVAWPALLFATLVWAANRALGAEPVPHLAQFAHPDLASLLLPAVFLNEARLGSGPLWNPPYWSLSYEVWYYALFAAATFLKGPRRYLWTAVLAMVAGLRILLLLPVWLAGVWLLHRLPAARRLGPGQGAALVAAGAAWIVALASVAQPVADYGFVHGPWSWAELTFSQYWLTDWAMTPGMLAVFAGLTPLAERFAGVLERCRGAIKLASASSFTLYLMHWPAMCLLLTAGVGARDFWTLALLIAGIQAAAILAAGLFERRWTPRLRVALTRLAGPRANASAPAPLP